MNSRGSSIAVLWGNAKSRILAHDRFPLIAPPPPSSSHTPFISSCTHSVPSLTILYPPLPLPGSIHHPLIPSVATLICRLYPPFRSPPPLPLPLPGSIHHPPIPFRRYPFFPISTLLLGVLLPLPGSIHHPTILSHRYPFFRSLAHIDSIFHSLRLLRMKISGARVT